MFKWFSKWQPHQERKAAKYYVLPKSTFQTGMVATAKDIPHHGEIAVNYADDCIYMNLAGEIIKYVRAEI